SLYTYIYILSLHDALPIFDLVILDPPSFARNKKKVFSVAKDYGSLIENSVDILSEKGMILASTNAENLSVTKFRQTIETSLINKDRKSTRLNSVTFRSRMP